MVSADGWRRSCGPSLPPPGLGESPGPPLGAAQGAALGGEADRLETRPPGYVLRVAAGELDALRFEQLAARPRSAGGGDAAAAVRLLERPWRCGAGPRWPIGRCSSSPVRADPAGGVRLDAPRGKDRRAAGVRASPGDARRARALTGAHPLRERSGTSGSLALYRCGRQAEALRAYRELSRHPGRSARDRARPRAARARSADPAAGPGSYRSSPRSPRDPVATHRPPDSLRGKRRRAHRLSGRRRGERDSYSCPA